MPAELMMDEEEELRRRHEAGDIVYGDDPGAPIRVPRGEGFYAQLFRAIYDCDEVTADYSEAAPEDVEARS